MTTAYWCVLIAGLMPLIWTGVAKTRGRRFDNHAPRDWLAAQQGLAKRAHFAQQNAFEAFPLFAAAVIIAHLANAPQAQVDVLALVYVGLRLFYGTCYLADWATLRTLVWSAALLCVIGLFVVAA